MKASLTEIMESVQGEGLLAGVRQVFLRFNGCNLRCSYCDTAESLERLPQGKLFPHTGNRKQAESFANPLSVEQVKLLIERFNSSWISLTGGEPLLWPEFIKELAFSIKAQGYKFLLETNGTLDHQLGECLAFMDMISMDIKLPSATGCDCWELHHRFLLKARQKPCYIKVVVTSESTCEEIRQAVYLIKSIDPAIPLILQPVTSSNNYEVVRMEDLLVMQAWGLKELQEVRIIPQLHPLMGLI